MAWFKDLAGRAENILNQIDHNAALALKNEKKEKSSSPSPMWEETFNSSGWDSEEPVTKDVYQKNGGPVIVIDSESSVSEYLLEPHTFENDNQIHPEIKTTLDVTECSAPVNGIENDVFDDPANMNSSIKSPENEHSNSTVNRDVELTVEEVLQPEEEKAVCLKQVKSFAAKSKTVLIADNAVLMRELQTAKSDNELLQRKLAATETDCNEYKDRVAYLQQQWGTLVKMQAQLRNVNEKMCYLEETLKNSQDIDWYQQQSSDASGGTVLSIKAVQKLLEENVYIQKDGKRPKDDRKYVKALGGLQQLLEHFSNKLEFLSVAVKKCDTARQEALQLEEIARRDAFVARQDFDQYKLRAQRILQDKERALTQLRGEISDINSGVASPDDTHYMELQALRHEHEVVCEEVMQLEARLQSTKEELSEAERRLATARDTERRLQEALESERRARQAAEDDCRSHVEELRAVREDLFVQHSRLAAKVRDREMELNKLRSQLSQRPVLPQTNDVESRLHSLTHALVQKQSAVEALTAERNATQLQLEKLEHKHQELLTHLHRSPTGFINLNDTDDAKAQVPSLFVESPFDTGVTRRVKRAYSTLDAVGIRTGVFLRRYPLARVLVFCYMILLHIWVMVVLFTYTPPVSGGQ